MRFAVKYFKKQPSKQRNKSPLCNNKCSSEDEHANYSGVGSLQSPCSGACITVWKPRAAIIGSHADPGTPVGGRPAGSPRADPAGGGGPPGPPAWSAEATDMSGRPPVCSRIAATLGALNLTPRTGGFEQWAQRTRTRARARLKR